ncbi:hypothetical protein [Glaciecola sp. 1036]|uniref:hypothetical protein n=1 Tax=Alteromonadaceae TaxID=72275 RepID=UPI003CFDDD56
MLLNKKHYLIICLCCLFTLTVCSSTGTENKEPASSNNVKPIIPENSPFFGFTPFPYAFEPKAVKRSFKLANDNGQIFVVQRDNGIPWQEALLNDRPYPKKVQDSWREHLENKPAGKPTYLALAPLAEDRVNLIAPSEGSSTSSSFLNNDLDDDDVKTAYLNYVRRAIEYFKPDYINIGLEAGELAHRKPGRWRDFESLYLHVYSNIKKDYPNLAIGISFGLQTLMDESIQDRVETVVKNSDFIGISFYPYMSVFHEEFGADPLPPPPQEWRTPLAWLGDYSKKMGVPIAICETGYSSQNVELKSFDLKMNGSEKLQQRYLTDLVEFAKQDNYLFVVWFMTVDYEKLFEDLKVDNDAYLLWQNIGFFNQHLEPKLAWSTWQEMLATPSSGASSPDQAPKTEPEQLIIGFSEHNDLFSSSSADNVSLKNYPVSDQKAMHWSFDYKKGRFQWLSKAIAAGELEDMSVIKFDIMSNVSGPILFQVEENTGEAFYAVVQPGEKSKSISISINDMVVDNSKAKNRKLEVHLINKITIADAGAVTENAKGSREIWISRLRFE